MITLSYAKVHQVIVGRRVSGYGLTRKGAELAAVLAAIGRALGGSR